MITYKVLVNYYWKEGICSPFWFVAEDPELTESKRRRFRTKRMRPDFFNPLDMEYSSRRRVKVGGSFHISYVVVL